MHTTSALCIGGGNQTLTGTQYMARYIGAAPPASPYNTPFQNFTTAFNANGVESDFENDTKRRLNNEPHEGFFIRNTNWLAAEMNRVDPAPGPASNCTAFCDNLAITGTAALCTSATYSVQAITGATYTWTALPAGSVTFSGSGNSVTATRNGTYSGNATIKVLVSLSACGTASPSLPVTVGPQATTAVYGDWDNPLKIIAGADPVTGATPTLHYLTMVIATPV